MVAQSRSRPSKTAWQLHIVLMDAAPAIWRRLLVPGEIKLSKLHAIFQAAMGWEDCHLHIFEIDGERYGMPDPDWEDDDIDEDTVVFSDVVSGRSRFFYEYDFGDSWRHEVVVESVDPVPVILKFAVCIDGRGACPPEDCGGTSGYRDLLDSFGDSRHDEHPGYVDWAGRPFDPEAFDLSVVNAALQRVR